MPFSTALTRGYQGKWEIAGGQLFLVGLSATLNDGPGATLATLLPESPDRVFASWFTGTLRAPSGNLLKYAHAGYRSVYEEDLLIDVDHGVVGTVMARSHGRSSEPGEAKPYMVAAMTVTVALHADGDDASNFQLPDFLK